MPLIAQSRERYLRTPRMTAHWQGGATLHAIAWVPEGERIVAYAIDRCGCPEGPTAEGPLYEQIVAVDQQTPMRPTYDVFEELRARDGDACVEIQQDAGVSEVRLRSGEHSRLVARLRGAAAAPAVVQTPDGVWVAYHTDVREDSGERDVAKWIELRFVDREGEVFEPVAPMVERDRDQKGEEQSFEFPTLLVGEDGALALFGRGSHCFWRQDLNAEGFGPREALGDGRWGSRGRRVTACSINDGSLLIARREGEGIAINRLAPPLGGPPALRPARIDRVPVSEGARASAVSSLSEHARLGDDPASRHGLRTFFGDIQQHSAHSDGLGTADEAYLRARDRYGDDFVALTDHESFLGKRTSPGEWAYLQAVADRFEEPGRFATLVAYEWTGRRHPGPGHKCVYLPRTGLPLVSRDDVAEGGAAVRAIAELGGFASPHHIGWTGCDESGHDPIGQPVWEICSCHGCYEHWDHPLGHRGELREQTAQEMLARGHRFGFTAASDSHGLLWHHGESRKRDPFRTGLTAVQAPELSRRAIFEALRNRRCYATSGEKILLDFTVADRPMGSELCAAGPQLAQVCAVGTAPIAAIELVGPSGVLERREAGAERAQLEVPIDARWVYARVIQADGEMAWSSPIFIDAPTEK